MSILDTFKALNNAAYDAARDARKSGHTDAIKLRDMALYTDLLVDSLPAREAAE
jgi:hypothetical protein